MAKHHAPHHKVAARQRRPQGALQRSLASMTVGVVKGQQAKDAADAPTALGEMVQHQQLQIAGKVGAKPLTVVSPVYWPYPYLYAPAQRDTDFTNPQFNYGIELPGLNLPNSTGGAVTSRHPLIMCAATGWLTDVNGFSVGAQVAVTAWIPDARKKTSFSAIAHLSFWGYGAPAEDDGADTTDSTGGTP